MVWDGFLISDLHCNPHCNIHVMLFFLCRLTLNQLKSLFFHTFIESHKLLTACKEALPSPVDPGV